MISNMNHQLVAWSILACASAHLVLRQFNTESNIEYGIILLALVVALALAVVSSLKERFQQQDPEGGQGDASAALSSIASAFDRIASIPSTAKKLIIDGVDSMAAAMRPKEDVVSKTKTNTPNEQDQEKETVDKENIDMNQSLYEKDITLWGKDRQVDPEKYKKMTARYANIHYMLCNLKAVDKNVHDQIFAFFVPSTLAAPAAENENNNKSQEASTAQSAEQ